MPIEVYSLAGMWPALPAMDSKKSSSIYVSKFIQVCSLQHTNALNNAAML